MYTSQDHTFAICAYKENPYLESTVISLINQSPSSKIVVSTSTPNEHIKNIVKLYGLQLTINEKPHFAGDDWNHAYNYCSTSLVTVVHQDDYYEANFLRNTLNAFNAYEKNEIGIVFTDYYEIRSDERVDSNLLLNIKRIMNYLYTIKLMNGNSAIKTRILGFGNPICCPAITYNKGLLGENIFDRTFKDSCDYKTLVDIAKQQCRFVFVPNKLVGHRIYSESATSNNIAEGIRRPENYQILCEIWPKPVARLINYIYSNSEKCNKV